MKVVFVFHKQYFFQVIAESFKQIELYVNSFDENDKESSTTFVYWFEYMDMGTTSIGFIESQRDSVSQISFFFYFVNMMQLKDKNYAIFKEFSHGNYVVSRLESS